MGHEQRLGTAMTAAALQQQLSLSLGQYLQCFLILGSLGLVNDQVVVAKFDTIFVENQFSQGVGNGDL